MVQTIESPPTDEQTALRPPVLQITGLEKRYRNVPVVDTIDLAVHQGEVLSILGPSGCGKTTTLRLIAGFEEPDRGSIEIGGQLMSRPGRCEPPEKRRVGMVFQDGVLFPHMSVGDNVGFGVESSQRRERVAWALEVVGLGGLASRMPYELSGGQQQRVSLARALAPNPSIILLDEPFASLDAALRTRLRTDVRQILAAVSATVIWVTHDQEEALSLSDRVAVMFNGVIVQDAAPEELYHRPVSRDVGMFVGDAQFLPGSASGRRVTCELGDLPTYTAAEGEVDVMIRPEALRLTPAGPDVVPNAVVTDRLFFGHDQLLRIELASGTTLNARLGSYGGIRPGDRVRVSLRGAVLTLQTDRESV
ncbi:MAG: ABC transporter ATP-binding protein [Thermomicrobiales bacterium]|nr:ABC transporter ATP-binding protein [Thermomicrobiales bacterium]